MIISQTALTLLEVGFETICGIPEPVVAFTISFRKPAQVRASVSAEDLVAEFFHEIRIEGRDAAKKTGIDQGSQYLEILGGQRHTFLQRAGGIAHFKADIPQRIEYLPDKAFSLIRNLFLEDKEHIHVRVNTLLLSAVTTQRNDGMGILVYTHPGPYGTPGKAFHEEIIKNLRMPFEEARFLPFEKTGCQFFLPRPQSVYRGFGRIHMSDSLDSPLARPDADDFV